MSSLADERPSINQGQVTNEVNQARNDFTYLISIGVTNSVDENTIRAIASVPQLRGQTYFMIPSYTELESVKFACYYKVN